MPPKLIPFICVLAFLSGCADVATSQLQEVPARTQCILSGRYGEGSHASLRTWDVIARGLVTESDSASNILTGGVYFGRGDGRVVVLFAVDCDEGRVFLERRIDALVRSGHDSGVSGELLRLRASWEEITPDEYGRG